MIRFLVRALVLFLAAVVGLIVADLVLDGMSMTWSSYVVDAALFAVLQAVLLPFILKSTARNASALVGAVGLITTFVALLLTSLFGVGLSISGLSTWLLATLIVWIVTLLATFLLPFLLVKLGIQAARERRAQS